MEYILYLMRADLDDDSGENEIVLCFIIGSDRILNII